jgi:tape measure domain-containing protein
VANDLEFTIGASAAGLRKELDGLRSEMRELAKAANAAAGGGKGFDAMSSQIRGAVSSLGGLLGSLAGLATVMKAVATADEFALMTARLKLATASTDELARAQVELFDVAQRTRTDLGGVVDLYTKIANATKDAGVGQETILQVVETIQQLAQVSGAAGPAAEAALQQLGQGLASGTLRGEELNSVLEQTPALADAIAKGMGITRGELRKYGEEGKITAEQVIKALQSQRDAVAAQFAQLPMTVGQAFTQLRNSATLLIGVFDQTAGATGGLATAISELALWLSSDEVIGSIVEFAAAWGDAFGAIVQDVRDAVGIIREATQDIVGTGEDAVQLLSRAFLELPTNIRTAVRIATTIFAGMVDRFLADARLLKEAFAAIFTDDTIEAAVARRNAKVKASMAAVKSQVDDILGEREKALASAKATGAAAVAGRAAGRAKTSATSTGKFKTSPDKDADKKAADAAAAARRAQLDAEEKLLADSAKRQTSLLDQLYSDGKLAMADYYRSREGIELAALDRSIEIARAQVAAAKPGADKIKAAAEVELLERQRADITQRTSRELAADQKKLDAELSAAKIQQLENEGRSAEAARLRLEQQYADLLRQLEAEGNTAGVDLIRGLIDTGAAKARFDELRALAERELDALDRKRAAIENRVNLGQITPEQGRQESAAAGADAATRLAPVNAELQGMAATLKDPALLQSAEAVGAAIKKIGDEAQTPIQKLRVELVAALDDMGASLARNTANAGIDALSNFFVSLGDSSTSAGERIKSFVASFAASMAQIAARALATFLVLQALDAIYPGLGQTTAASMSVGANVKHSGGMAGQGTRRQVHPALFAGAPRFHAGSGVLGLKAGEVPAILQEGERVQSRAEVAASNKGQGGGGYRIVNVMDPALVSGYLESAAGERAVLNVISRNPGAVSQSIGR